MGLNGYESYLRLFQNREASVASLILINLLEKDISYTEATDDWYGTGLALWGFTLINHNNFNKLPEILLGFFF